MGRRSVIIRLRPLTLLLLAALVLATGPVAAADGHPLAIQRIETGLTPDGRPWVLIEFNQEYPPPGFESVVAVALARESGETIHWVETTTEGNSVREVSRVEGSFESINDFNHLIVILPGPAAPGAPIHIATSFRQASGDDPVEEGRELELKDQVGDPQELFPATPPTKSPTPEETSPEATATEGTGGAATEEVPTEEAAGGDEGGGLPLWAIGLLVVLALAAATTAMLRGRKPSAPDGGDARQPEALESVAPAPSDDPGPVATPVVVQVAGGPRDDESVAQAPSDDPGPVADPGPAATPVVVQVAGKPGDEDRSPGRDCAAELRRAQDLAMQLWHARRELAQLLELERRQEAALRPGMPELPLSEEEEEELDYLRAGVGPEEIETLEAEFREAAAALAACEGSPAPEAEARLMRDAEAGVEPEPEPTETPGPQPRKEPRPAVLESVAEDPSAGPRHPLDVPLVIQEPPADEERPLERDCTAQLERARAAAEALFHARRERAELERMESKLQAGAGGLQPPLTDEERAELDYLRVGAGPEEIEGLEAEFRESAAALAACEGTPAPEAEARLIREAGGG
ncbi:MAG: hypothetical protein HY658_07075 [Actinobacteria bacterium]|nr:hypothetical protein [Actinomycetota bacterium]